MSVHLILGGARSGKSRYAEQLAHTADLDVFYIATAQVQDAEFAQRVAQHQARRPAHWQTVVTPHYLAQTLVDYASENRCLLVDCLTLWLAQCLCLELAPPQGVDWHTQRQLLLDTLPELKGKIILVSNEVGMGIVPIGQINRQFQDESGWLNQAIAACADQVFFIAAGLPLQLK